MKMLQRCALATIILMLPLAAAPTFSVSFSRERSQAALDGRLLLIVSSDPSAEPRMQINNSPGTQMIFGADVEGMQPGQETLVDDRAFGYPVRRLSELKPGQYYVQAVLHRYETFHLASGQTVKLPMDRGEGQHWNLAPGNLYSKPQEVTLEASTSSPVHNRDGSTDTTDSGAERYEIRPARTDKERTAERILGTSDVSGRACPGAGRLRRTHGSALSAGGVSWALSFGSQRVSH